jgi:hypothetical protein
MGKLDGQVAVVTGGARGLDERTLTGSPGSEPRSRFATSV